MPTRVAINGFGRIGRAVMRSAIERGADLEIVAVNDIADAATLAHLLAPRLGLRPLPGAVVASRARRASTAREIRVLAERDPASCPGRELGVDVVIEATGRFRTREEAAQPSRGGRAQGDPLRARQGRRAGRRQPRARRELRRGLRPGAPPHRHQRLVHDELPRAGGQGAARDGRHPPRPDDDRARLHGRPEPARRAAQGPAPRARRGASTSSRPPPAPRRRSGWSSPSWPGG